MLSKYSTKGLPDENAHMLNLAGVDGGGGGNHLKFAFKCDLDLWPPLSDSYFCTWPMIVTFDLDHGDILIWPPFLIVALIFVTLTLELDLNLNLDILGDFEPWPPFLMADGKIQLLCLSLTFDL